MNNLRDSISRVDSIDALRGLVMLLMLLDHSRMFFNREAFLFEPTDLSQTTLPLFLTRWITHFCAPAFVFLSGTSAYFVRKKMTRSQLSIWLVKRGLWLIFLELTIVKFAWLFHFNYQHADLMVIWGIGLSMLALSGLIWLPRQFMLGLVLLIIAGHNLLDGWHPEHPAINAIWRILHVMGFLEIDGFRIFVSYPVLPMIGLIGLGYCFGELYQSSPRQRLRWILAGSLTMVVLFIFLRLNNAYGDPSIFTATNAWHTSLMSFLNTNKYPHSFQFILMTIGPLGLWLYAVERWRPNWIKYLAVYGKTPLFFYLIHILVIHLVALVAASATGYGYDSMIIDFWVTYQPELKGFGTSLPWIYVLTVGMALLLYPLMIWFRQFKTQYSSWRWLKYF